MRVVRVLSRFPDIAYLCKSDGRRRFDTDSPFEIERILTQLEIMEISQIPDAKCRETGDTRNPAIFLVFAEQRSALTPTLK